MKKLTDRQQEVLNLIIAEPMITRTAISQRLGISLTAVQKHITSLKEKGYIMRRGGTFGGYWDIQ